MGDSWSHLLISVRDVMLSVGRLEADQGYGHGHTRLPFRVATRVSVRAIQIVNRNAPSINGQERMI